jgi:hypothetical protein
LPARGKSNFRCTCKCVEKRRNSSNYLKYAGARQL